MGVPCKHDNDSIWEYKEAMEMILVSKRDFGRKVGFVVDFGEGVFGRIVKEDVDPMSILAGSEYENEMSIEAAQELANSLWSMGIKANRDTRDEHFSDLRKAFNYFIDGGE